MFSLSLGAMNRIVESYCGTMAVRIALPQAAISVQCRIVFCAAVKAVGALRGKRVPGAALERAS